MNFVRTVKINNKCSSVSVTINGHNNHFIYNGSSLKATSGDDCIDDLHILLMILFGILMIIIISFCVYCCCRCRHRINRNQSMICNEQQGEEKKLDSHV